MSETAHHACPVCGYPELEEAPYDSLGCASFEICSCCGVEFGYDDASEVHAQLRLAWMDKGANWFNAARRPVEWSFHRQLSNIPVHVPAPLLASLRARYSDPGRHYHSWDHIEALLRHYRRLEAHFYRPVPVLWALYWHDAIYDPMAKDNEEQSAVLLEAEAEGHLPSEDIAFAARIIRATAKHLVPDGLSPDDEADLSLFLDMDLSILGAPPPVFDQYERDVRAEYAAVPDDAFRSGRAAIMKNFLDRPRLYFTDICAAVWEAAARDNLARSIAALEADA